MKAQLNFDLNDSDDIMAHFRCVKAEEMAMFIWELVYNTKKTMEHEIEEKNLNAEDLLDFLYEHIHEMLGDKGINIDELII